MAKRIRIEQLDKDIILERFKTYLNNTKLSSSTLTFSTPIAQPLPTDLKKAQLYISSSAYLKMMLYVRDTSTEIAWHGTVIRENGCYYIKDVFLYPQTLSAATVTTDQVKYTTWLAELPDETFNTMRFQGHSHVNFSATPSCTDLNFYDTMLQNFADDDFYIFMIMNKQGETSFLIYDLAANLVYETQDIDVHIVQGKILDLQKTIKLQKEEFCEKPMFNQINFDSYKYSDYYNKQNKNKTEVDRIFDDLDRKWTNPTLHANTKKTKKKGVK